MNETERRAGVHGIHCCKRHGCKYGERDCPVRFGDTAQMYPCEMCEFDNGDRSYWVTRLREEGWVVIPPMGEGTG